MMVRNRPIVLHDGDYLLPIYHEVGDDTETVGADSTSLFLRYDLEDADSGSRPARSGRRRATSSRRSSKSRRAA